MIDKHKRGLYGKFIVNRVDGTDAPGMKHHGCDYYVLDLTHDPHAIPSVLAYANSCQAEYPLLAADLRKKATPIPDVTHEYRCPRCNLLFTDADAYGEHLQALSQHSFVPVAEGSRICEVCHGMRKEHRD